MHKRKAIVVSLRLLARQWRRTATTAMAFAIGLGSFGAFAVITAAARAQFLEIVRQHGAANVLTIVPAQYRTIGGREVQVNSLRSLTLADAGALQEFLAGRASVAPVRSVMQTARWRQRRESVTLIGTTGNEFGDARRPVALITHDAAAALFGYQDPVGLRFDVGQRRFTVIGFASSVPAQSTDMRIVVPLRWAPVSELDRDRVNQIVLHVNESGDRAAVMRDAAALLRRRHRLEGASENDFTIRDESALLRAEAEVNESLRLLLPAVSGLTLAIGGIGVAGVMLLAIRERAGEIGLRRAAGASRADIVLQFITEALLIAGPASVLGEVIGGAAAAVVAHRSGWPVTLERWPLLVAALLAAFLFAVLCSLGPALRAARLEPAVALRAA